MTLEQLTDALIADGEAEHIAICVGKGNKIIKEVYKSKDTEIDEFTKFDMASVTKILATTTLALIALDKKLLRLEDTVSKFFTCPEDKKQITIQHLLTHTMGMGHKSLLGEKNTLETVADYILNLPLDIPVGSDVLYSCPGFVLLGKILEIVFQKHLNVLFEELVTTPLGMKSTSFLPKNGVFVNSNTEPEKCGVVNDYNCQFLGGVAGNAGVFSTMHDMKIYVNALLRSLEPLLSSDTFFLAVKNHTPGMKESRGLGFVVTDARYKQTGNLFSAGAIGHCGHTGQSVFVDFHSGLFAIVLSDMTIATVKKYGSEHYENVMKNREKIHHQIYLDLFLNGDAKLYV